MFCLQGVGVLMQLTPVFSVQLSASPKIVSDKKSKGLLTMLGLSTQFAGSVNSLAVQQPHQGALWHRPVVVKTLEGLATGLL